MLNDTDKYWVNSQSSDSEWVWILIKLLIICVLTILSNQRILNKNDYLFIMA